MDDVFQHIRARQAAIQNEIDDLNDEARSWKLAGDLYYHRHLLIPEDVVTKRTAHKFAVLGQVAKYLTKNAYNRQSGASATDIYRQIARDFPTMSPSTFRSQLTRFKNEGRLIYDDDKGTWNLAKREEVAP
ncbi:hypothetical protein [Solirhodobacter olei]|uniref:hypothetical protein n=1 Tax=Solirhodobacter olei TaxID=2493082 RepID=UPI000FD8C203|nr:hypothetical protein [Solirhodobacter olei]